MDPKAFKADNNKLIGSGDDRTNETVMNLYKNKKSKKSIRMTNIGAMGESNFLTPNAKKTVNYLWLAFIKALIF